MFVKVGDKVKTTATHDVNGTHLASFVRTNTYDVIQVGGKNLPSWRVVIGKGKAVTAAVNINTLTVVGGQTSPVKTPTAPPAKQAATEKVTTISKISDGSLDLAAKILNSISITNPTFDVTTINGSKVQYLNERYDATYSSDYNYTINQIIAARESKKSLNSWVKSIERNDPSIIQNASDFPITKSFDNKKGYYKYDYYMDYNKNKLNDNRSVDSDMPALRKSLNIDIMTRSQLFKNYTERYNKYKLNNPNDHLSKTFSHVFFVRPDCNIYAENSSGNSVNPTLVDNLEMLSEFYYAKKHSPEILRQLTQSSAGYNHQFMLYPSNKARSFEISDEYITSDTYGQGLTGYKVAYGKNNVESRTSGKFSINYIDDRDLHVYNLHKLWIDYISYVYRGKVLPKNKYILNKVIDYATCLYYIVCAEDGETIIFWSKYWGVFPIEAPSSAFSYTSENGGGIKDPELRIEYQYAWKEDFNPLSIIEFNKHSSKTNLKYVNNYQDIKLGTGYTWGGAPFVETFNNTKTDLPYTFKLRFRPYS